MKTVEYYGEIPKRLTRNLILKIAVEAVNNDFIGSQENIMNDNSKDSKEYKEAEEILNNHEKLLNTLYNELMELEYVQTGFMKGIETKNYLKFEGKEEIIKEIENNLKEEYGY